MAAAAKDDEKFYTRPMCAARTPDFKPCQGIPVIACPKCYLVAYCTDDCRTRHWPVHRDDCSSILKVPDGDVLLSAEKHDAMFDRTYHWIPYAATDVLNLEKNEGRYFDDELNILLGGAQSNLRHLIYSIVKMPETASPSLKFCINELDDLTITRTFYALQLLFDKEHDTVLNAEAVIHLIYSARMTKRTWEHIRTVVYRKICHLLVAARRHYEEMTEEDLDFDPGDDSDSSIDECGDVDIHPRTPIFPQVCGDGKTVMIYRLGREQWVELEQRLRISLQPDKSTCLVTRALDKQKWQEPRHLMFSRMTKARALGVCKWESDGILLPFGHPREGYDVLNPLFFGYNSIYPTGASGEPLSEWPTEVLDYENYPAPNDVYGKLFFYLRDMLVEFQRRCQKLHIEIRLSGVSMKPFERWQTMVMPQRRFDRIEAGLYWDDNPLVALIAFGKMLRHQDENPFATLLTMTRTSVVCPSTYGIPESLQSELTLEKRNVYMKIGAALDEYAPPMHVHGEKKTKDVVRRKLGLLMWRNWDRFSARYLDSTAHLGIGKLQAKVDESGDNRSAFETGLLGIVSKERNTVTRRWPNRLVHGKRDEPGLRAFNRALSWADLMPQRWLEWKRNGDVKESHWRYFMRASLRHRRGEFEEELVRIIKKGEDTSSSDEEGYEADDDNYSPSGSIGPVASKDAAKRPSGSAAETGGNVAEGPAQAAAKTGDETIPLEQEGTQDKAAPESLAAGDDEAEEKAERLREKKRAKKLRARQARQQKQKAAGEKEEKKQDEPAPAVVDEPKKEEQQDETAPAVEEEESKKEEQQDEPAPAVAEEESKKEEDEAAGRPKEELVKAEERSEDDVEEPEERCVEKSVEGGKPQEEELDEAAQKKASKKAKKLRARQNRAMNKSKALDDKKQLLDVARGGPEDSQAAMEARRRVWKSEKKSRAKQKKTEEKREAPDSQAAMEAGRRLWNSEKKSRAKQKKTEEKREAPGKERKKGEEKQKEEEEEEEQREKRIEEEEEEMPQAKEWADIEEPEDWYRGFCQKIEAWAKKPAEDEAGNAEAGPEEAEGMEVEEDILEEEEMEEVEVEEGEAQIEEDEEEVEEGEEETEEEETSEESELDAGPQRKRAVSI